MRLATGILTVVMACVVLPGIASAATITADSTAPTGTDIAIVPDPANLAGAPVIRTSDDFQIPGQSIYGEDGKQVAKVHFRVAGISSGALGAEVCLRFNDMTGPTDYEFSVNGSAAFEADLPSSISEGDYLHFDLEGAGPNFFGRTYGIVLHFTSVAADQQIKLWRTITSEGDIYSDGRWLHRDNNGNWVGSAYAAKDVAMWVEYTPEPASLMVMALGGGLLALRRRRRTA